MLLSQTLCLCLALAFTSAAPTLHDVMMADHDHDHHEDQAHHKANPDRCDGIEFDAIAPDEKGHTFFFKGDHLWNGFTGPAQVSSAFFKELDDHHHLGHVDAAFRMHNKEKPGDHDHIYFFLEDKVFSYYNHSLEKGYPKNIQLDFPGVPSHLDAAVECPKGECNSDSVLFFKGEEVYNYDIATQLVKKRQWAHLPNCTSAYRWLEQYYCFHGHNFTRFHPVSGEVNGVYPKDARHYFMSCPNFGHGGKAPKCSEVTLDAITSDDSGKTYAFTGQIYMRLDTHRDGKHTFPIARTWKELANGVDAVFSYSDKIYIIKGDQVYIYKSAAPFTLIEGYPKSLKEELGIEGPVNAAFVCAGHHIVHIIQGQKMQDIDLSATPRVVAREVPLPIAGIEAGMCGPDGVKVYVGSEYYHYESPRLLAFSKMSPEPKKITPDMMGCVE
ncbi:hemopexin [Salmo salar]|uniref:Hemopexin n=1 Tax=Salmo salar TaxID=8030 RepID=A0A1S3MVQ2_SALSA|nr:hemopexin [Salmo salar]|eukprot:XP_014007262.1 PREDICTED: hemopexin-like [Salmo salar]